jgi:hypothetical protein
MNTAEDVKKMRVTQYEKNRQGKQWYKNMLDYLDYRTPLNNSGQNLGYGTDFQDSDKLKNDKINYNLFNGIIDKSDFEYVYQPLGQDVGELPADFTNKDIISGKLKVLMGMELERPFAYRINAVNPEATTRKEKVKFDKVREYVVQQIMQPIRTQLEQKYAAQQEGQELTSDQQQQIAANIEAEMKAMTPEEVQHYMKRDHQDPAEIMMSQIFNYINKEQNVHDKFNKGWKHAGISAKEFYWIGIINGKPVLNVVNPLHFTWDKESDEDFVENGEWAGVEMYLTPSQVVEYFGDELTNRQIDELYAGYNTASTNLDFSFDGNTDTHNKIRVIHRVWRALRKIAFVSYIDPNTGTLEERLENEGYKLNPEAGDIRIEWEWIPEIYEGYKINADIYVRLGPVASQPKNMQNLYNAPLPYRGGIYDSMNSTPTSLVDRMKPYQFEYNIIMYRIQMLMASDKGKLLLMNMNMIPNSMGIDMKQWLYYADALNIGFMNPNEEGNQGIDISTAAKEIDMSLVSDIQKYMQMAEFVERKCGDTIGVTKEMEGRIGQYQAVKTTETAIAQGNYIVEPYFDFHNIIKKNVLTGLLEMAALAYSMNDIEVIDYILDDFSKQLLKIDKDVLSTSDFGLFVSNSMDTIRVKEAITNLALTAMQNQTIDMSDVVKVMKKDSVTDAEEQLAVAEERKRDQNNALEKERMAHEQEMQKQAQEHLEKLWQHEADMIVLKEGERRKTEIQKQTILAMGFAENKDVNDNNVPDVLEVAREGLDAALKMRKQNLDENKFEHQKKVDEDKIKLENKKLEKQNKAK